MRAIARFEPLQKDALEEVLGDTLLGKSDISTTLCRVCNDVSKAATAMTCSDSLLVDSLSGVSHPSHAVESTELIQLSARTVERLNS